MSTSTKTMPVAAKSKKHKKPKAVVENTVPEAETLVAPEVEPSTPEEQNGGVLLDEIDVVSSSVKKRKREDPQAEELEINVNLPEPPSKKALRKAKKQKTTTPSAADVANKSKSATANDEAEVTVATTSADQEAKDATAKRSEYGIWIGNLPWGATKPLLRDFLTTSAPEILTDAQITRVHMPPPANAKATRTQIKPLNKGFAYVDFASQEALDAAMALSESMMGGRRVLIKNSKSFEGRPDKAADAGNGTADGAGKSTKPPSKRVFIGNLSFDVTVADLREHFEKCGAIADVHMATFEDSGKCKGFAWVTFEEIEAAEAAVRGFVLTQAKEEDDGDEVTQTNEAQTPGGEDDAGDAQAGKAPVKRKKYTKPRKWFVNRLQGRPVRCEFAEDATVRYKKRFGKEGKERDGVARDTDGEQPAVEEIRSENSGIQQKRKKHAGDNSIRPGAPTDPSLRRGRRGDDGGKREWKKGAGAAPETRYRTGAITEPTGKKMTF